MSRDYGGILNDLTAGRWYHPDTGEKVTIPIGEIAIRDTLDGAEPELMASAGFTKKKLAVVSDRFTHDALAGRIVRNLEAAGFTVDDVVWRNPIAQMLERRRCAT